MRKREREHVCVKVEKKKIRDSSSESTRNSEEKLVKRIDNRGEEEIDR